MLTVQAISGSNPYDGKYGPMVAYKLTVVDEKGAVTHAELSQKTTSPAPEPGQQIDGVLEEGKFGPRIKKNFAAAGGGAPRGKTPEESAAIQRMHLQKTAPDWVTFLLTIGVVKQPADDKEAFQLMTRVMDWLSADIERAKKKVAA